MIDLKLEALAATENAGFGFEAIGLAVTHAETISTRQHELIAEDAADSDRTERCAALVDTLRQRLGARSVCRFEPVASHIPECAEVLLPAGREASTPWLEVEQKTRPLLLLPHAEPAEEVMALIPDGPPRRFCWRGVTYEVAGAQGPERIGAEWWRDLSAPPLRGDERQQAPTRDYYIVEDANGHRFWLYREGLYGRETDAACWFVHGLFA
jgi:protein ImuB